MKLTNIVICSIVIALSSNVGAFFIPSRTYGSRRTASLSMVADDAKVILVTGSSRGLGKSIALDLGKHQQKVVINYVSEGSKAGAEATVEEIKAMGGDAIAVQADSKCFYCISVGNEYL
jgi:predicted lactoylglutathione lyase